MIDQLERVAPIYVARGNGEDGSAGRDMLNDGDTHVETVEHTDGILCVNPGSPTFPRNLNTQLGTIGFLDIEDGKASASIWQIIEHGIEPSNWSKWRRPR